MNTYLLVMAEQLETAQSGKLVIKLEWHEICFTIIISMRNYQRFIGLETLFVACPLASGTIWQMWEEIGHSLFFGEIGNVMFEELGSNYF